MKKTTRKKHLLFIEAKRKRRITNEFDVCFRTGAITQVTEYQSILFNPLSIWWNRALISTCWSCVVSTPVLCTLCAQHQVNVQPNVDFGIVQVTREPVLAVGAQTCPHNHPQAAAVLANNNNPLE